MYIYVRRRVHNGRAFLEIFLTYTDNQLQLPTTNISRFDSRILRQVTGEFGVHGCCEIVAVNSSASSFHQRSASNIKSDGFWATYHDTVPKGGPIGAAVSTIYGLPVDPRINRMLYYGIYEVYKLVMPVWADISVANDPYVIYHGTARSNVASIAKNGLQPTFGMLGTGIYFGTFWKAWRFATMTQDYEKRPGAIIRVLAFWPLGRLAFRTSGHRCYCTKCIADYGPKGSAMADHLTTWAITHEAVWAYPYAGGPIKNEEYACKDTKHIMMESWCAVSASTEHHEPLNRTYVVD